MNDLTERLRERKLFKEAADEIERLTGERDRQYDKNCEQIIRIASLEAEIERLLRLQEIVDTLMKDMAK
jgi:hypothetical protein